MKAVVQRVSSALVEVAGEVTGKIGWGLLVLVGVGIDDGQDQAGALALKVHKLRVFGDAEGKMNLSLADTGYAALVVSQFTLFADTARGNRPSFVGAAPPETAEALVEEFVARLRGLGTHVETGRFRAHMEVSLVNDGPVTVTLEV